MTGSKHSAPPTAYWASGMTQEQIIEVYRDHHAKQLPPKPVALNQHPFIKLVESHFGTLTLIKVAEPKV
jgi:hypothetical protein